MSICSGKHVKDAAKGKRVALDTTQYHAMPFQEMAYNTTPYHAIPYGAGKGKRVAAGWKAISRSNARSMKLISCNKNNQNKYFKILEQ